MKRTFLAVAMLLLAASQADAKFLIERIDVQNRWWLQEAEFDITFNQIPDFETRDEIGRWANAFQLFFLPVGPLHPWSDFHAIGRAVEQIGEIRFRMGPGHPDYDGPAPERIGGGWGNILGVVPWTLDGLTLNFTAPHAFLGAINDRFVVMGDTYEFGSWTGVTVNTVPEPSGLALVLAAVCSVYALLLLRLLGPRQKEEE